MTAPPQNLPPPFPSRGYAPNTHYDAKPTQMPLNGQGMSLEAMGSTNQMAAQSLEREKDGKRYTLRVEQQPVRARMCGFGDKDRRPITPPPCIKLVITDIATGREVPADCIDPTFFVLQVDLWDETGLHEKNVVRAANNSPATSISTATTTSYPPPPDRIYTAPSQQMAPVYHSYGGQMMVQAQPQNPCAPQMYQQPQGLPPMYGQNPQGGYYPPPQMQQSGYPQSYGGPPPGGAPMGYQSYPSAVMPSSQPQTGMFTRNLIGSLTVNAFTLKDPKNNEGHWFILQDLSVRTEGTFRLKMNFVDVGSAMGDGKQGLSRGTAPVLASVFSQPFQVFSAKKFPGVIESTELSKTFAGQGIKIPIRKDGGKSEGKDEDDD